jgi:subtilase family serine protease
VIARRVLALAATLTISGCAGGSMPPLAPLMSGVSNGSDATSATRTTAGSIVATAGNGTLALPGNGTLALPSNGTLALPGNGTLALPGNGTLALPGGGAVTSLLAALVNALPVCALTAIVVRTAQCNALLNTAIAVIPNANLPAISVPGLHPADVRAAYRIPNGGNGQTVAVVDAGDDPTAESDLAVYRSTFGLPECTSSNGCFRKVGQSGSAALPSVLAGWPQETGIDIQMISAVCPSCNILLVEANSADMSDLAAAVDTAAALGASAISNSYYAPEYDGELADETHFDHAATAITVSSGDTGFGTTFPASSRYVTAVGGTSLARGGSRGWSETVWPGTGSGCSTYVPKPAWQHDGGCAKRTVADVAVIGDPQTGVAVYNTTAVQSQRGWGVYGGTSVGAPIVAALYAVAGNARSVRGASSAYAAAGSFNAVLWGTNGKCSPAYLCTAVPGYNGPAGVGTPNGVAGL